MNVKITKITQEESVIEVETRSGMKHLTITKTDRGHSYNDFAEWDISDKQYYDLEELVDGLMKRMEMSYSLNVSYEV